MPHLAVVDDYNKFHENNSVVFVSATESSGATADTSPTTTLSVRFAIDHQICPDNNPMKKIGSVFARGFEEPVANFTAGAKEATSAARRMLAALELPFRLGGQFEWEPDATASEPLGGLDDVAARLSELFTAIVRRRGREMSVKIVMLTALPPPLFEVAAELFFTNHVDEDAVELETVLYDGGAEEIKCAICMDDVAVGSQIPKLECCHKFHEDCLSKWLQLKTTCPVCRLQFIQ